MLTQGKNKKGCAHPMLGLWPHGTVHRYLHFLTRLRAMKTQIYRNYEHHGGEFHGAEDTDGPSRPKSKCATKRALALSQEDYDDDTDFC